jgi:hypothetical protein
MMRADPNAATGSTAPIEPTCALLVMCVECGQGIEATLPIDYRAFVYLLATNSWFPSVLTPPNQGSEVPILFGALCPSCAQQVYSPEVFQAAEERRQQMLQRMQEVR